MISSKVLVLNKNWIAIGVASIQRTLSLLFSEYSDGCPKAHIITPPPIGSYEAWSWSSWTKLKPKVGENSIISAFAVYKVPEVILLSKYDRIPSRKVSFCRRSIWKRDEYTCQYCGVKTEYNESTLDHVVPKSKGGETSWTNCVLACYRCNFQKSDREPQNAFRPKDNEKFKTWRGPSPMRLLKEPKKPEFSIFKDKTKVLDTWKHWVSEFYWEIPYDLPNI